MKNILLTLMALLLLAGTAQAATWQYPSEVSVAWVYNDLYATSYNTTDSVGLGNLLGDHGTTMQDVWTTDVFSSIQVPVFDTGSSAKLGIYYGSGFSSYLEVFDPGTWTNPSRGYMPNGGPTIDLAGLIGAGTEFKFAVGSTLLTATNSIAFLGLDGSMFIGYNEGGWSGDADFNEPLIHAVASTPIPGAVWLLGTGLLGLVGLRRFTSV